MTDTKKTEQLHSKLFSGNDLIVFETLQFIKEQGSIVILPSLLDLYITSSNKEVKQEIYALLIDAKIQGFQKAYMELIQLSKYESLLPELLSVCWQSSLSFAEYVDLYVTYIIKGDFRVAFESLTILETVAPDLSTEKRESIVDLLKSALQTLSSDKRELLHETIQLISGE